MINYDDLPLFPLHVVLFPEMPLPLHIFEPRYREMILRCREEHSPFGVTLIQSGEEAISHPIGTMARITQFEELPDGRMNILVIGEKRFQVIRSLHDKPYLSAQVRPFGEQATDTAQIEALAAIVAEQFKVYLKSLLAMTGRSLGALQLPQDPEALSYAIASVLQIENCEKQSLLEMTDTTGRLAREAELLQSQLAEEDAAPEHLIVPANTRELGKLASLN